MKVKWHIEDGYISRKPDFSFELDDSELDDFASDLRDGGKRRDIEDQLYALVEEKIWEKISLHVDADEVLAEIERRAAEPETDD